MHDMPSSKLGSASNAYDLDPHKDLLESNRDILLVLVIQRVFTPEILRMKKKYLKKILKKIQKLKKL